MARIDNLVAKMVFTEGLDNLNLAQFKCAASLGLKKKEIFEQNKLDSLGQ